LLCSSSQQSLLQRWQLLQVTACRAMQHQQPWPVQTQRTCSSLQTQSAANGPGMMAVRLQQMQMPASVHVQRSRLPWILLQLQQVARILQQLLPLLQPQPKQPRLPAWLRSWALEGSCLP
jgi:hypothetical protein